MKNDFEILGLKPGATLEEIQRAYREKIKLCHPDISNSCSNDFIEIQEAYKRLMQAPLFVENPNSLSKKMTDIKEKATNYFSRFDFSSVKERAKQRAKNLDDYLKSLKDEKKDPPIKPL